MKVRQDHPAACRMITKVTKAEMDLEPLLDRPGHIRAYGLTIRINDTSARLVMDTGVSGISIDEELADKAGVKKLADTTGGIGDEHEGASYIGWADKIRVGNLEFENCQVDVLKERTIAEHGIIGTNVFRDFLVDIDMPKHKLKLSQLPPYPDQPKPQQSLASDSGTNKYTHDR